MLLEQTLTTVLAAVCTRVHPDIAPPDTDVPYITWQTIGGPAVAYEDDAMPDARCAWVQISCWAASRLEAINLMLAAEAALVTATATGFTARPQSAMRAMVSDADHLSGNSQDFEIWAPRA